MTKIYGYILIFSCYFFIDTSYCGVIRVKRVIGGEPDNTSDFGYLAILVGTKGYSWDVLNLFGDNKKVHCSGALINDQWIITAAHCFTLIKYIDEEISVRNDEIENSEDDSLDIDVEDNYSDYEILQANRKVFDRWESQKEIIDFTVAKYWKVRLAVKTLEPTFEERFANIWNFFAEKSTRKTYYQVSKIIRHPNYTPWNLENDVALLKLKEKLNITLNDSTKVIPLSRIKENEMAWPGIGQMCKVIGWGCVKLDGPIMNAPHSVNLPVLSPNYCRRIYRADINLTESQEFCAGYYGKNIGICSGDSGGPLICNENGQQVLAGVVSATHINNPSKYPGIFSRIGFFRNWINDIIDNE